MYPSSSTSTSTYGRQCAGLGGVRVYGYANLPAAVAGLERLTDAAMAS